MFSCCKHYVFHIWTKDIYACEKIKCIHVEQMLLTRHAYNNPDIKELARSPACILKYVLKYGWEWGLQLPTALYVV